MLTVDDLVIKCPVCGRLHTKRISCEGALRETRELFERAAAEALNRAWAALKGGQAR